LLDLRIIFWIVISVIGGSIVGAMPGISPTMAVALVVPFTFVMNPVEGLLVLGGIFVGGVYGGSISAILLNIPGAPANIATIIDGYPMAKKGQARRALVASAIASAHGGMVGALGLMLFAPLLAAFALGFGTAEIFWAAIFGLVIIDSLLLFGDFLLLQVLLELLFLIPL
jgi:putative tricarboxylic transport membrane protein